MRLRYRAQALGDIDEIGRYFEQRSPTGALNVLRAIYAGIIVDDQTVEIIHVRHTSRRPWQGQS